MGQITAEINQYNEQLLGDDMHICIFLANIISDELEEATQKIWHAHPVWFINENPIVGYSKQKKGIRLMFWSGADFNESLLNARGAKFKDASIFYNRVEEVEESLLRD